MHTLGFSIAILSLSNAVASTAAVAGAVLDRITESGVMVMATDPVWPPFSWQNEAGEYEGFDIEVALAIAGELGVTIEFVTPTWDEITIGAWKDKWDISVGSMTPTAKRDENLDFPACYYFGMDSLAVHSDNATVLTPADASGKLIGVLKSSIWEQYLNREPFDIVGMPAQTYKIDAPVIVTYENADEVYDALAKGDGAELVAILDSLSTLMAKVKAGEAIRIVGQPLIRTPQCVAIEPGDAEFGARLGEVVSKLHNDGTLTKLSLKWFEFDVTKQ